MKLQSQIQYEESIDLPTVSDSEYREKSRNHRNFLKQPLKLGMFVPCDENDVPFSEIKTLDGTPLFEEYQQAKERVIFEGFEIKEFDDSNFSVTKVLSFKSFINCIFWFDGDLKKWYLSKGIFTIEYLIPYNLTITDSAIKKYNL